MVLKVYKEGFPRGTGRPSMKIRKQANESQMERWSLNQAPLWAVPPLAIANQYWGGPLFGVQKANVFTAPKMRLLQ